MPTILEAVSSDRISGRFIASDGQLVEIHLSAEDALIWMRESVDLYERAREENNEKSLISIGRNLFDKLNFSGWAKRWCMESGPRQLEILAHPTSSLANLLLATPWKLLALPAETGGFLIDDDMQPLVVWRRLGAIDTALLPSHADFHLLFMAAAPENASFLDYDAEELAIKMATQGLELSLAVEDSGALEPLRHRLCHDIHRPFQALHLSCHGNIDESQNGLGPFIELEKEEGGENRINAKQLVRSLGGSANLPPLIFLSACTTATSRTPLGLEAESFVQKLVRSGVANVLGWDGSVYDIDAQEYARHFYEGIANGATVPDAVMLAQSALRELRINQAGKGEHWHLARLYLGPKGGGALVKNTPNALRRPLLPEALEFLEPVA